MSGATGERAPAILMVRGERKASARYAVIGMLIVPGAGQVLLVESDALVVPLSFHLEHAFCLHLFLAAFEASFEHDLRVYELAELLAAHVAGRDLEASALVHFLLAHLVLGPRLFLLLDMRV